MDQIYLVSAENWQTAHILFMIAMALLVAVILSSLGPFFLGEEK